MIIAGSFLKVQEDKAKIDKLNECVDMMHFDVMDGNFTENKTLDFEEIKVNTASVTKNKDIHLMVTDIYNYIDLYSTLEPYNITFHYEIGDTLNIINYIKEKGIKVGLAINPSTDVSAILPFLDKVDLVLVMSVVPGKGGQKFIDVTHKIDYLAEYRDANNLDYLIEVDGGINDETIKDVEDADIAVCGSYITDSDDYDMQVKNLKKSDTRLFIDILITVILVVILVIVILI